MERILVLGATGLTGRLVARALEDAGREYAIAGRDRAALERLSSTFSSRPEIRVADAGDTESLHAALGGMRAVVTTVGPFLRLGMPVATAAVDLGVHYVDTTGEQLFQMQVYEKLHRRAVSTGATVVTGAAFESTFGYLGAAVLHERCGPLVSVRTSYFIESFRPSRGTVASAIGMLGQELAAFHGGKLVPLATSSTPREVRFAGETGVFHAVEIPGGDAVTLPLDIASLQSASCQVLLPRSLAFVLAPLLSMQPRIRRRLAPRTLERIASFASRVRRDPSDDARDVAWKVFVEGQSPSGDHLFVASGRDVYQTSAVVAAQTAMWLANGRARDAGVMTTGKALDAVAFLDALRPHGMRWELR